MKTFEQYINESRQNYIFGGTDNRTNVTEITCSPVSKGELIKIIKERIKEDDDAKVFDLNDIDVSKLKSLSSVFGGIGPHTMHNFDISEWDTSNVTEMQYMFAGNKYFNGDISLWDTSSVVKMNNMFMNAEIFNQDISNWDVRNVKTMNSMFYCATSFNQDLSKWDVSNCEDFTEMFRYANSMRQCFQWDIKNTRTTGMCWDTPCAIGIKRK